MVALLCIGWYLCGVLGCVAGVASEVDRGIDFTVGDLVGNAFGALGGVITLVAGGGIYLMQKANSGKVLIKGNRK